MDSPSQVLTLSTIFMLLLFLSNATKNAPSKLVQKICKETHNPANCLSALEPHPRTTNVSKLRDLEQIVLEVAVVNTTASQTYIKKMINTNNTTPAFKEAINYCVSNSSYGFAIGVFSMAIEELDSDLVSANADLQVACDGARDCEQFWRKNVGIPFPPSISTRNSYMNLYCYLGNVITMKL